MAVVGNSKAGILKECEATYQQIPLLAWARLELKKSGDVGVLQPKPVAHMKQRERPLPVLTLLFAVPDVVPSASKRTITWITGRRPTHNCFRLDQKYFYKVIFYRADKTNLLEHGLGQSFDRRT